jgi:hypothetical protein
MALSEHLMNHWKSPVFEANTSGTRTGHDVESTRRACEELESSVARAVSFRRRINRISSEAKADTNADDGTSSSIRGTCGSLMRCIDHLCHRSTGRGCADGRV